VSNASRVWRDAVADADRQRGPGTGSPEVARAESTEARAPERPQEGSRPARVEEEWVLVEEVRDEAQGAVARGSSARGAATASSPLDLAEEVRQQLSRAVGTARSERVERRLREAADDFEHERFGDASRILKKLSDEAPTVAAVRELYGLTLYRQGKWRSAAKEL
jgi:hypothetical protein